jgi:hypothetical protein
MLRACLRGPSLEISRQCARLLIRLTHCTSHAVLRSTRNFLFYPVKRRAQIKSQVPVNAERVPMDFKFPSTLLARRLDNTSMAVGNTLNLRNCEDLANGLCFKMTNATKSALPVFESALVAEQQSDTPNQHCRCHQKLVAGAGCFCPISIRLIQGRRN